ncbi:MAG: mycofactocin biosynthesis chaperone MftB [Acidimicrobiales bacterium]
MSSVSGALRRAPEANENPNSTLEPGPTLDDMLERSSSVGFRREPFGALAYNYETRALHLVKSCTVSACIDELTGPIKRAALLGDLTQRGLSIPEAETVVASLEKNGILIRHGRS